MQNQSASKKLTNNTSRINLVIPQKLLDEVDKTANNDFTTRSEVIRAALLWYLRPDGVNFGQTEPDMLLAALQKRRLKTYLDQKS